MRHDKARLPVGSQLLVEDIAAKVKGAAGSVALVGQSQRYRDLGLECFDDRRISSGPIAGIEAALLSGRGELNLIVACDMPDLDGALLRDLIDTARTRDSLCVVSRDAAGQSHPLCAVWKPASLPHVQRALDSGQLKVFDLLATLDVHYMQASHAMPNVNTPGEWLAWRAKDQQRAASLS